jgi:hypothetical protein
VYATLLLAEPDFLSGMGSTIDLRASVRFNESRSEIEADFVALRSDLMAIGADMVKAAQARLTSGE